MNATRGCAFLVVLVLAVSRSAVADEFDDFRIPEHSRHDWRLDIGLNGDRVEQNEPDRLSRNISGLSSMSYRWLSDSEPAYTAAIIQLIGEGTGSWTHTHSVPPFAVNSADREVRYVAERWRLSAFTRRYPWNMPLGFSLGASVDGYYQQSWQDNRSDITFNSGGVAFRSIDQSSTEAWSPMHSSHIDLTVGWGRVRDASGVYEARLLEHRLLGTGGLTRPLSEAARRRLAALLTVRVSYDDVHDRAAKSLWRQVTAILEQDGALGETDLDPSAVLRVGEPHTGSGLRPDALPRTPFLRNVGYFIGPTIIDSHAKQVMHTDYSSSFQRMEDDSVVASGSSQDSQRDEYVFDDTFAGVVAEAHRPIGLRWQTNLEGRFLIPLRETSSNGNRLQGVASLSWMVSDRWEISGSGVYQRSEAGNGEKAQPESSQWLYRLQGTWFIEDRLSLSLNASETQWRFEFGSTGSSFRRSGQLSLQMTYRILGGFEAPGLIPRETFAPF